MVNSTSYIIIINLVFNINVSQDPAYSFVKEYLYNKPIKTSDKIGYVKFKIILTLSVIVR